MLWPLPVEVLDGVEREVEHDDVLDKGQVQPTRRHVRAHMTAPVGSVPRPEKTHQ